MDWNVQNNVPFYVIVIVKTWDKNSLFCSSYIGVLYVICPFFLNCRECLCSKGYWSWEWWYWWWWTWIGSVQTILFQLRTTKTQGESTSEHQRYSAEEKVISNWLQLSIACIMTWVCSTQHAKDGTALAWTGIPLERKLLVLVIKKPSCFIYMLWSMKVPGVCVYSAVCHHGAESFLGD